MKKLFSTLCLLFLFLSQFQVLQVYAQGEAELASEKQAGEQTLDAVEQVIDSAVVKIDAKLGNNEAKKDQLEEKQIEIHEYLEEVSADIQQESSSEDIKEKVEEAKKVVVLKVVSGVTEYEDVEDSIDSEVADTPAEIEEALETIQDSMETESGDYSIIVRSRKTQAEVQKLFATFDSETEIEAMYDADGKNYFEVFLAEDSIFREEMLEDIESGILPENFLGVEIVLPEVFGINEQSPSGEGDAGKAEGVLEGEDLSQTWGIEQYKSHEYIEGKKSESQKIKVAVVDTGIDYKHPDLKSNVNQNLGKDFVNDDDDAWDDQGHGTHVAGTIAANINGSGIIGVNPHVELVPLKICTSRGFCPSYAVLRALDYAKTQKIDILNMSLGGRGNPTGHAICGAIASVVDAGGIVVAASGNSNIDTSRFVPGGCAKAITVAAVDSSGMRAVFSNYGSKVDVAAPGVGVYSTYPTNKGNYKKLSGTSMATPHVVGIISLMQARDSDITASEAKTALKKYTNGVQTDRSYKTIASGIDLEKLLASYDVTPVAPKVVVTESVTPETTVEDEGIRPEEKKEVPKDVEKTEVVKDDAVLDPNLKELDEATIKIINLNAEEIEINDAEENSDFEEIDETLESQEVSFEGFLAPKGKDIEINSDALPEISVKNMSIAEINSETVNELRLSEEGDIEINSDVERKSMADMSIEFTELEIPVEDSNELGEEKDLLEQIFLEEDENIQINSSEDFEPVEEIIENGNSIEFDTLIENHDLEPIVFSGTLEEGGVEINSSDDIFHKITQDIIPEGEEDKFSNYGEEEVQEDGIEINSFGENEEEFLDFDENTDIGDEEIHDEIEEDHLPIEISEDGIEINNFEEEEVAEEFQQEEILEDGIEINSFGENEEEEYVFDEEISEDDESSEEEGFGIQSAIEGDKDGLIAEYLLNGNTKDTSINKNHGILHGATWKTASQEESRKIGQNQYLRIGKNTTNYVELPDGIVNGLDDFSLSFWVRRTDSGGYYQVLNAYNNKLLVGFIGNTFAAVTNAVYGDRITARTRFVYNANTWNHYTVSVEGSEMKLYENGKHVGTKKRTPKTITGATGIVIGQEQDSYHGNYDVNQSLAGDIANLKIYNKPLNSTQAENLFHNNEVDNNSRPLWKSGPGGLVAEYNFDGDVKDSSPNKNHGTLHGANWKTSLSSEKELIGQDKYLSIGKNTTNYVELPDGIVNGLDNFTMSTWLKRTDDNSYYPILNAFNNRILFSFSNTKTAVAVNADYKDTLNYKARYITHKNSWNHYSFVVDGTKMKLYENGKLVSTRSRTAKVVNNVTGILIGQEQDAYHGKLDKNQSLAGDIAGLQIYNKAISDSEAENIYYNKDITDSGAKGSVYHEGETISELPEKIRYIRDHLRGSNKNSGSYWVDIQAIDYTGKNIAKGKPVTSLHPEYSGRPYSRITDGSLSYYSNPSVYGAPTSVVVDLQGEYEVNMVKIWHYYKDGRIFNDTKTEVSVDGIHWYVLHDADRDGTYTEAKNGSGRTYELKNTILEKPSEIRYIRDHTNGNNRNGGSHWMEIQAYDNKGINIAKGKKVTGKYPVHSSTRPYSWFTDGSTGYWTQGKYPDNWLQIDLGKLQNIEMLKVWHYYPDSGTGRIYKDTKTEISADGMNWYALHDSERDGTYVEPKDKTGKIYRLSDEALQKTCVTNISRNCHFTFHHASSFDFKIKDSSIVSVVSSSGSFKLVGKKVGTTQVQVSKNGITYYDIEVEIIAKYQEYSKTLNIGQTLPIEVGDADRYDISVSQGDIVKTESNSKQIRVTGLKSGKIQLYLMYKGAVVAKLNLTVTSPTYDTKSVNNHKLSIQERSGGSILLDDVNNYTFSASQGGMVSFRTYGNHYFIVDGIKKGKLEVYVTRKSTKKIVSVIDVTVTENLTPSDSSCKTMQGQYCDVILKNAHKYSYSVSTPGIISYAKNSNTLRITGENPGYTKLYIKDSSGKIKYTIDISIASKNTVRFYDIDLYAGQEMKVYVDDRINRKYTVSEKGIVGLYVPKLYENGVNPDYIYLKGYSEGETMIYVSGVFTRVAYVLKVNIIPKPKQYECEIEIGMTCYLNIYPKGSFHQHLTYSIANKDVIYQHWWRSPLGPQLTIKGIKPGTGYFRIHDSELGTHTLKIKVVPVDTTNQSGECELDIEEYCEIRLRGTGDYDLTVSNPGTVFAFRNGNKYHIYGRSQGTTKIYIKKNGVTVHTVSVGVSDIKTLELTTKRLDLKTGEEGDFSIVSGNGEYRVYKSNDNISVYKSTGQNSYKVYPHKAGTTTVRVYDKAGKMTSFTVSVTGKEVENGGGELETEFESFFLLNDSSKEETEHIVAFNIKGKYTEVGIEYKDKTGNTARELLDHNEDGFYIIQPDIDKCESCHLAFQPYVKSPDGNIIYPNGSGNYMSLGGDEKFRNIGIVENGIGVANSEGVEISNFTDAVWNEVEESSTIIILNTVWIYGGVLGGYDISSYMLSRFMHGDGSTDYYDGNHWISKQVKKTTWYSDKITLAKLVPYKINPNSESLIFTCDWTGGEEYTTRITDSNSKKRENDFKYSFGTVCPKVFAGKNAYNEYYIKVVIEDIYDFKSTYNKGLTTNALNAWATYYQEQGLGKIFNWKLEIIEKIY